jgi:hypothetical protein
MEGCQVLRNNVHFLMKLITILLFFLLSLVTELKNSPWPFFFSRIHLPPLSHRQIRLFCFCEVHGLATLGNNGKETVLRSQKPKTEYALLN